MGSMFSNAGLFNQDLNGWDVAEVTNMSSMFSGAIAFNGAINEWDVGKVTTFSSMFSNTSMFNQNLNAWNVSLATNFSNMFFGADAFNSPLNNWNLNTVDNINMSSMFSGATAFNQNIGDWDIQQVTTMASMLDNSGLTRDNYDATLIGWSGKTVRDNVSLGAENLGYCDSEVERQTLIDTNGWVIAGDIKQCDFLECTTLISPMNGAVDVPDNFGLSWNPVFSATGYRVTIAVGNDVKVAGEDVGNATTYVVNEIFNDGDVVSVTITPYNASGPIAEVCDAETFTAVSYTHLTLPTILLV